MEENQASREVIVWCRGALAHRSFNQGTHKPKCSIWRASRWVVELRPTETICHFYETRYWCTKNVLLGDHFQACQNMHLVVIVSQAIEKLHGKQTRAYGQFFFCQWIVMWKRGRKCNVFHVDCPADCKHQSSWQLQGAILFLRGIPKNYRIF